MKHILWGCISVSDKNIHNANIKNAIFFNELNSFKEIHSLVEQTPKLLVFITKAEHKIKKKAEQHASENAINLIKELNNKSIKI